MVVLKVDQRVDLVVMWVDELAVELAGRWVDGLVVSMAALWAVVMVDY